MGAEAEAEAGADHQSLRDLAIHPYPYPYQQTMMLMRHAIDATIHHSIICYRSMHDASKQTQRQRLSLILSGS